VERRNFFLFLILSFLVIQITFWFSAPPPKDQPAGQPGAAAVAKKAAGEGEAQRPVAPVIEDAPDEGPDQPAPQPEAVLPIEYVTLGSVDDDSGYRMGVTVTNAGAAVRRIELASSRYSDLHDHGGYIGHLELIADGGAGLLVQAVVAGTPAERAGVKVGDRLIEAGRGKLTALKAVEDLYKLLDDIRPGRELQLVVQRDGNQETLSAKTERRPLEVLRPEDENVLLRLNKLPEGFEAPPSFLFTLQEVDGKKIADDAETLPGVDLHEATWRIVPNADNADDEASVTFERRVPQYGLVVTRRYRLRKADKQPKAGAEMPAYDLTLEVTIRNEAEEGEARSVAYRLDGPNGLPIEGWWYATKVGRDWGAAGIRDVIGRYFGGEPVQQGAPDIATGDVEDFEGQAMAFMGVDAQYFCVALVPQVKGPDEGWIPKARSVVAGSKPNLVKGEGRYANVTCRLFSESLSLAPGESVTHAYTVFAGPKIPLLLAQYKSADVPAYSLDDFVYYGWFGAVARLMVGLLHIFYNFAGNYGLAIIMLTVLVRSLMFPVSRGQAKSMAKLQELRPEMERIKEKYKGDQQKQAQAMQQLYRKHNVNPLSGCLPMLIQLPVFIGLYRGLAVDVELRGSPLISENFRWCSNLAAPDMLYDWSAFMPRFISSGEGTFSLGPYLNVLPLVTIALFLWQQKMFMPEPTSEQAAMQQKVMKWMMVLMGILFYKVPSGLCIYFIASSLWGIAERKLIPPPTPPAMGVGAAAAPPTKPGKSGGTAREKRPAKNGRSSGKPKRRR